MIMVQLKTFFSRNLCNYCVHFLWCLLPLYELNSGVFVFFHDNDKCGQNSFFSFFYMGNATEDGNFLNNAALFRLSNHLNHTTMCSNINTVFI